MLIIRTLDVEACGGTYSFLSDLSYVFSDGCSLPAAVLAFLDFFQEFLGGTGIHVVDNQSVAILDFSSEVLGHPEA